MVWVWNELAGEDIVCVAGLVAITASFTGRSTVWRVGFPYCLPKRFGLQGSVVLIGAAGHSYEY